MGIMDGVLGGLVSAGVTAVVSQVIKQSGGLQGLASQFEKNGLGSIVQSWIGTGENKAINPQQIQQVLGMDSIKALAEKAGLSVDDLSAKLSEILPDAVDKLTPEGKILEAEPAAA